MILLPTLNRISKLTNFLNSAIATSTSEPGLIIVDNHDFETNRLAYETLPMLPNWKICTSQAVTMADKIREVWPRLQEMKCEYAMIVNDDHECVSQNWDKKLISLLDGKNFVSANDRSPRTFIQPVTATAWSMPLLDAVGWPIYPPNFKHLFIDDIWKHLGKATGCWRIAANAVVVHNHVLFGAPIDDTHSAVYGPEFHLGKRSKMWDEDEAQFRLFMKHDFDAAVKKIKAFQDYLPGEQFRPLGT